jgi:hypothetical protein
MAHVTVFLEGIRIHVGFYRDGHRWRIDDGDVYVADDRDDLVSPVEDIDRLGGLDDAGAFRSLRCLAEHAANDDAVTDWNRDQRRYEQELQRSD